MLANWITGRAACRWLPAVAALLLSCGIAGCGHKSTPTAVGVSVGVSLSTPTGLTLIQQGGTIEIDSFVSGDPSGAGVSWQLFGAGGPVGTPTPTQYVYQAPASVTGALTVTLVASAKDPALQNASASVTITVNGSLAAPPTIVFPANLNIPYVAYVLTAGGVAPYVWTSSGTLPDGLALNGSTTGTIGVAGTPTKLGSFSFTLTVTDASNATVTVPVTLVVNPQTACLLLHQYAYLFTGFRNGLPVVRAGSINIASDGSATGIQDYKDAYGTRVAEAVTSGTCTTVAANRGNIQLISAVANEVFNFATVSALNAGQLQENDGTPVVGSGQMFQQDAAAFLPAAIAGDYGFGLVGDDGHAGRVAIVGRLHLDAAGVIANGEAVSTAATMAGVPGPVTGTFTAPDANGRGTATLSVNGESLPVAYYVVDANTAYLVSNDTGATSPRIAGRMTRQTGAGSFGAAALAVPSVLSLIGSSFAQGVPVATVSAGLLSGAAGGTLTVLLDSADRGAALVTQIFPASPYSVATNGRGALTITSGGVVRNFVLYLTGPGSGYVLEPTSTVGNFGFLAAQVGAPYTIFNPTYYAGGTVFAASTSPITLAPQLLLQDGSVAGNLTGSYAIDPLTGRISAGVSRNILGGSGLVMYVVTPQNLVVIGNGVNSVNSSLAWLLGY